MDDQLQSVLDRLLDDQEVDGKERLRGQFARHRSKSARSAVQKDQESLDEKPELYMTFNAVQALTYLHEERRQEDTRHDLKVLLDAYKSRVETALRKAGELSERLLREHSDRYNFVIMQEKVLDYGLGTEDYRIEEFRSYRHTIGSLIVLVILTRVPDLVDRVVMHLLDSNISNKDGGWPISNKEDGPSDLLCSVHAAFLFDLMMARKRLPKRHDELDLKRNAAVGFITAQAASRDGLWQYGKDRSCQAPITARTYPQLYRLLVRSKSPLLFQIPRRLLAFYRSQEILPYSQDTESLTGIRSAEQFVVRLAFTLRSAAKADDEFLEPYLEMRQLAIANYSNGAYYETYDLCCLLIMMIDSFAEIKQTVKQKVKRTVQVLEPLVGLTFVGRYYRISREVMRRAKEQGWLP